MALLALTDVTLAHGGPAILDGVALQIEEGERIGLLGRNASGKSTLLSVIAGDATPNGGKKHTELYRPLPCGSTAQDHPGPFPTPLAPPGRRLDAGVRSATRPST